MPPSAVRRLRLGLSVLLGFLLHCVDVLLNGKSLPLRLWSVIVGAFPPFFWTFCFKQAKHIPSDIRPPINIHLLPYANSVLLSPFSLIFLSLALVPIARLVYLYGHNPDKEGYASRTGAFAVSIVCFPITLGILDYLAKAEIRPSLDLLAFVSYGALHFASPFIAGWWLWFFGTQGAACTFGWCLGIQNLCGLMTHLIFPNAAPWFYDLYGQDAAQPDYTYPGNPAGLTRVDDILGTHIYKNAFSASPVVFGAIPSLHAATCICIGYFVTRYSKGYRGLAFMWIYCSWMFWSTMYLHHHFAIDLVLGTIYSTIAFTIAERIRLRRLDREAYAKGLTTGWERLVWGAVDGDGYAYGGINGEVDEEGTLEDEGEIDHEPGSIALVMSGSSNGSASSNGSEDSLDHEQDNRTTQWKRPADEKV